MIKHAEKINGVIHRVATRLVTHYRKPLHWVELASAVTVYAELTGLIHVTGLEFLPSTVHPLAATGTIATVLAHVGE